MLHRLTRCLVPLLVCSLTVATAGAAEPRGDRDLSAELPRIQPLEPNDALKTFEIAPGFSIQRVAAEPLITSPVAMCFDADGKLYVVEMRDYSEQEHEHLGQIRLLEDTDSDGVYDKSTVFAEGLSWPTALICFDGGLFVGAAPDIFYLKDTTGDSRADEKRVVFTGFGRTNVQGLMNSFRWGLDSRIHGATSSSGGVVRKAGEPEGEGLNLRGRNFSFDPRKLDLRAESGGGQHGMCFDDWGRKFVCSNSRHADFILFDDRYVARNPYLAAPSALVSIAAEGGQGVVYRSSPVEPWRILRTQMRLSGEQIGAIEGNGTAAGYFTGATGMTIFRGDALGDESRGTAIVGDVGSNLVHRKSLTPDGIKFLATRIDPQSEFVRSNDIWFRPVQFENAPDGCLYILDMYREVIEHPLALPQAIKQHLDLTSGRDRGRLYRVHQTGLKPRSLSKLDKLTSKEIVDLLSHDNAWHRETASRLLFERQDTSAVPALRELALTGERPLGRFHAMWMLQGLSQLDEECVLSALADGQPEIRESAVRLSEQFSKSPAVIAALGKLVTDEAPRVRYQLAFSAGEFPVDVRLPWLAEIIQQDGQDPVVCMAVQSSLQDGADRLLTMLLADSTSHSLLLPQLAAQVARQATPEQANVVLEKVLSLKDEQNSLKTRLLVSMMSNSADIKKRLSAGEGAKVLNQLYDSARKQVTDDNPVETRLAAISVLRLSTAAEDLKLLLNLLAPHEPASVQSAALTALAGQTSPAVAEVILARWSEMTPSIRTSAEELLFSRPAWTNVVLTQLESGALPMTAVPATRLVPAMNSSNKEFREKARRLHASYGSTSRAQILKDYADSLSQNGSAEQGKLLFAKHCSSCHRLQDVGHEIGPNLATIKNRGAQTILVNVLDPNREINPEYLNYVVSLTDGRTQTGMIRGESATSLTLVRAENQSDSLLRSEIEQIRNTGMSLMPEGLEKELGHQGLADLIAYLMSIE